jgi:hypothetical protein
MIHNNRQYQRQITTAIGNNENNQQQQPHASKHRTSNSNNGNNINNSNNNDDDVATEGSSFQSVGVSDLGEELWRTRRRSQTPYVFIDEGRIAAAATNASNGDTVLRRLYQPASEVTLCKLEHIINTLSIQYQRISSLPPEPPPPPPSKRVVEKIGTVDNGNKDVNVSFSSGQYPSSSTTSSKNLNTSALGPLSSLSSVPLSTSATSSSSSIGTIAITPSSNTSHTSFRPPQPDKDYSFYDSSFIHRQGSQQQPPPPPLLQNRYHAAGIVNPGNSSVGEGNNNGIRPQTAAATTNTTARVSAEAKYAHCDRMGSIPQPPEEDDIYDDYDHIFATIDVDKVISSLQQQQQSGSSLHNTNNNKTNYYPATTTTTTTMTSNSNSNMQQSTPIGGFDYGNNNYYDENDNNSNNNNNNTNHTGSSSSTNWHSVSSESSSIPRNSNNNNNNIWLGNDNNGYNNSNNNNNNSSIYPKSNSSGGHSNMTSNNINNNNNNNVPLCSGHGILCRILTANTSINMGRQFYKCSIVNDDQKCDFFQWVDGIECNTTFNTINNDTMLLPTTTSRGDIRDMNEGNRRVFGHRSFRPGQQAVIQKAIEGRDVFVLMPTGYVVFLCVYYVELYLPSHH